MLVYFCIFKSICSRRRRSFSFVGTIAMFLVGGGILTHSIPFLHHLAESVTQLIPQIALILSIAADGIAGLIAGTIIAFALAIFNKVRQ